MSFALVALILLRNGGVNAASTCSPPLPFTELWTVMTEATGHTFSDLGQYDVCQNKTLGISQYCLLYTSQHLYGVCVPIACSPDDIRNPNSGIMDWLIVFVSGLVLEDPWDATIYCGDNAFQLTPGAGVVIGVLVLLAGMVCVGTMLDRLDRALKHAEVVESLNVAAEVSATNEKVKSILYAPPMADVDGGVIAAGASASSGPVTFNSLEPAGWAAQPSWAPWPGDAVPGYADSRADYHRVASSGSGTLVATSAAARFSLGVAYSAGSAPSSPVVTPLSAPKLVKGGALRSGGVEYYGSPTGMELSTASVLLRSAPEDQFAPQRVLSLRAASSSGLASFPRSPPPPLRYSTGLPISARASPSAPSNRQPGLQAGSFPEPGDSDASADFVGHVKARRVSSSDAPGNAFPVNGEGKHAPYDVQSGSLFRAGIKCFSAQHNWPRMVSIAPSRSGELSALNGIRVVSLTLIILGESVFSMLPVGFSNAAAFVPPNGLLSQWPFQAILSSDFGVGEKRCLFALHDRALMDFLRANLLQTRCF
jgi:hypothetical protein